MGVGILLIGIRLQIHFADVQVAVNKAKAALNRHGVLARKAEKERKKQVQNIQAQGGIIPSELLVPIPDPEKNPTPAHLEALQAPSDLLQALLMLEPTSHNATITGDLVQLEAENELGEVEVHLRCGQEAGQLLLECHCQELGDESNSDSSSTSCDSIARNADFITFN